MSGVGRTAPKGRYLYRFFKRFFDIVVSFLVIVILFVPSLILSLIICIQSPGSAPIYVQDRVSGINKDGTFRTFKMFKFRTMVPDADKMVDQLQKHNQADGPLFKIKDDPRIFSNMAKWMRVHSVDELPQFINCFLGEMSLVGPRPPLAKEVGKYGKRALRRLEVKPGLTGYWQISGRSNKSFRDMVDMDIQYIEERSFATDARCVFKTIGIMFSGYGAY